MKNWTFWWLGCLIQIGPSKVSYYLVANEVYPAGRPRFFFGTGSTRVGRLHRNTCPTALGSAGHYKAWPYPTEMI
jgi:hypothetical protein